MNERKVHLYIGFVSLKGAIGCVRAVRRCLAAGDRVGAILAYLDGCLLHGDSFMRAPRTSRARVLRALVAAKAPLIESISAVA